MQITYNQVKKILDTLPIGYYLGHAIPPVKLSKESDSTHINQITEEITVSFQNVQTMLQNAPDDIDVESIVRGLLYHEVSHAVLTPAIQFTVSGVEVNGYIFSFVFYDVKNAYEKKFKRTLCFRDCKDLFNIVEDERIETLLKDYYLNVDFRKNVVLLNGITDPKKELENADFMKRFFLVCRYHVGTQEELSLLKNVISNSKKLTNKSDASELKNYFDNIDNLAVAVLNNVKIPSNQDNQNQQSFDNKKSKDGQQNATPSPVEISDLFKDTPSMRKKAGEIKGMLKKNNHQSRGGKMCRPSQPHHYSRNEQTENAFRRSHGICREH